VRKEDCQDMFQRIPVEIHAQVNLVMRNGYMLSVDTIVRFEPTYMVFRGREGGTTDEGRAFFVPYEEICHLKIERAVRLGELKLMYGETGYIDAEDRLSAATTAADAEDAAKSAKENPTTEAPAASPAPMGTDPASIAKQNLLRRIRTARANVAGTTGKLATNGNGSK
jgi:hypothetical protein